MAIFETFVTAYITTTMAHQDIGINDAWGQSFTPQKKFTFNDFQIYGYRGPGAPGGNLNLKIYGVDVAGVISGLPTGSALLNVSFASSVISAWLTSYQWNSLSLGSGIAVASGTQYACVLYCSTATNSAISWNFGHVGPAVGSTLYYFGNLLQTIGAAGEISTVTFSSQTDFVFRVVGAYAQAPVTTQLPDNLVRSTKLVAVANDRIFFESPAGTMAEITAARDTIDVSIPVDLIPAYQKMFVVNGSALQVIDFTNTRLWTSALGANAPDPNNVLTGGTSGAQMIVDYVTTVANASAYIYGLPQSTVAFSSGETITGTDDAGNAISFTLNSSTAATSIPLYYEWTVYGQSSTFGSLPTKPTLGCLYRGRIVLAGSPYNSHQWYMSRQGNPWDWNYVSLDAQSPIAGNDADIGIIGDSITALIPRKDDYLIFGCANSMWLLRGDAAEGGSLDPLTLSTGIFGPKAWCWDSEDSLFFWGTGGIYVLPIQAGNFGRIQNLTSKILPSLVKDETIDPNQYRITMGYDRERHGILICITKVLDGTNSNYWLDLRTNGIFPESYPANCGPSSLHFYNADDDDYRHLLVGSNDGYIRFFDESQKNDDNGATDLAISAYVTLGPYSLSSDGTQEGKIVNSFITLGGGASGGTFSDSDGIKIDYFTGDDAETTLEDVKDAATPFLSTAFTATGRNIKTRTKIRGNFCAIKCSTIASDQTWGIERIIGEIKPTRGEI